MGSAKKGYMMEDLIDKLEQAQATIQDLMVRL